jgi:hypothetical protein
MHQLNGRKTDPAEKKKKRGEGLHPLKGVFTTARIIILCKADI